jgi:VIT1/CCC1 family predicted Fe2+/Mn2+ transporter
MRYFLFALLFSLPFFSEAAVAVPIAQGETVVAQPITPHGFVPQKERFFDRVAKNILQKRLKKALGRSNSELAKPLAVSGFLAGVLGIVLLFATGAAVAALLIILAGLVLSIFGLVLTDASGEKWVKAMAIAGIVLSSIVILGLLVLLILLIAAFS